MLRYHSTDRNAYVTNDHLPPISRTVRYKKFTKPLLERKRRARMNRCLDELKLLVGTLEAEGENINKLEKADILELTVRYIKRISRLQDPLQEAHRFQAGFSQCATEAFQFLLSLHGSNSTVGNRLVEHLRRCLMKPQSTHRPIAFETAEQNQHTEKALRQRQFVSPIKDISRTKYYEFEEPMNAAPKLSYEFNSLLDTRRVDRDESSNSMWRPW